MHLFRPRAAIIGALSVLTAGLVITTSTETASADGPGVGTPWVVTVGDSYISREAGRWAGSIQHLERVRRRARSHGVLRQRQHRETINRCHRSQSAEAYLGGGVNGLNLACCGARTSTYTRLDGNFKPGLDFYDNGAGQLGQARMLQPSPAPTTSRWWSSRIGGNDFNFAAVVQQCVTDFLDLTDLVRRTTATTTAR